MTDAILNCMAHTPIAYTAAELSEALGYPRQDVVDALRTLQDEDRVLMRNGWYWLSAAERKRRVAP